VQVAEMNGDASVHGDVVEVDVEEAVWLHQHWHCKLVMALELEVMSLVESLYSPTQSELMMFHE